MADATPLQSIAIPRTENRSLPTPHVVYAILVSLPVRSWTVFRRYSEFAALHSAFLSSSDVSSTPPAPFPPKHSARRTIKAITGLGGLVPQGDAARKEDEAAMQERRRGLETYLRAIVASPDHRWRESDDFRAFIELPKGQDAVSALGNSVGGGGAAMRSRYVPGSYSSTRNNGTYAQHPAPHSPGATSTTTTTRTLGGKPPLVLRESDVTRTLDDRGLMASQQSQMDAQDRQLDGLSAVLRRQKAMGMAINQELHEQSELLDELDQDVDKTQTKMRSAERQMDKLR